MGITATPYQPEGKYKRNIQENAEVDTRAHDFNQKIIMHVLDILAEEYEVFMLTTTCAILHWMYSTRWMDERVVTWENCWNGIEEKMPELVENLTCLNVFEGEIRKSGQKVVTDEELVQNGVMDEKFV